MYGRAVLEFDASKMAIEIGKKVQCPFALFCTSLNREAIVILSFAIEGQIFIRIILR